MSLNNQIKEILFFEYAFVFFSNPKFVFVCDRLIGDFLFCSLYKIKLSDDDNENAVAT
jgi:hypothetical protein